MRNQYILLVTGLFLTVSQSFAQTSSNFATNYEPVRKELSSWDPVRGAWLSQALPAVINRQPIPDRTFPENVTPNQMLSLVPKESRDRIINTARANRNGQDDSDFWAEMDNMVTNVNCTRSSGRSYGDPHLVSFDGVRFPFQTVGEFVLAKSNDGGMEVQTRQKPVQDDFSLNTAVAMNVHGDRVCLYAEDYPDMNRNTPVRLNGNPISVEGTKPYFLPNGGVITRTGSSYIIDWPTGESLTAKRSSTGGVSFYNVSVGVTSCSRSYNGVLGNANGSERDDFNGSASTVPSMIFSDRGDSEWEKQRAAFIAKDFAEQHRVTQAGSLFDYAPGQSTFTFTDRSFPRVHRTVGDLDPTQRELARKRCQEGGVRAADMNGCIYDNAYLNIEPSIAPPPRTPIQRSDLKPVDPKDPVINKNPDMPVRTPVKAIRGGSTSPGTRTIGTKPTPKPVNTTPKPSTRPVSPAPSTPSTRPTPSPRPISVPKPTPRPTPTTRPTPKPKPVPAPKPKPVSVPRPSGRGGR